MALSHESLSARVMVVGKNPLITRALTKLLELDDEIKVVGEAPSVGTAPIADLRPDIIILDESGQPVETAQTEAYIDEVAPDAKICLLDVLRDLTVSEVLETVKHLAPPDARGLRARHLHAVAVPAQRDALASLSERELEVVRLVAEGLSNKEISSRLSLSDKTVKNHISHILAKMNLTARTQVAVYAIRAGLV
jgi:DNA-binding NarL/FixJ family response regulator